MERQSQTPKTLTWARNILKLEEKASLRQIKDAYRRRAKESHPDVAGLADGEANGYQMHEVTEAYSILRDYCNCYPIPLDGEGHQELNAEDWWFDRFGQDPLWGRGGNGK